MQIRSLDNVLLVLPSEIHKQFMRASTAYNILCIIYKTVKEVS